METSDSSTILTKDTVINVESPDNKDVNNTFPEKDMNNTFPEKGVNTFPEKDMNNTFPEKGVNTFPENDMNNTFPEKGVNTFAENDMNNTFPEKKDMNNTFPEKDVFTPTVMTEVTAAIQEKAILKSVVCKYLLYVVLGEVNSQKAIQSVTENNVQIVDVKSLKKKPDWLKGVPTAVEVSTGKVYEGTNCLLLLKNDIEELNVNTSNCYRDKPKQAVFMFSNVMKKI
jgi:hypothetical protein